MENAYYTMVFIKHIMLDRGIRLPIPIFLGPGGSDGKESGELGLIPGLGEKAWQPSNSYLENPKDTGAWQAIAHRSTRSRTWLSN